MPKLPRIGSRECIAALGRMGFAIARQRGSHIVLRRGASGCENHREIKPGTLAGILKQAGVSVDELIDHL